MIFSSYEFLFLFLPVVVVGFIHAFHYGPRSHLWWLLAASLFFYGWWKASYLLLLTASICANYGIYRLLLKHQAKWLVVLGVALNFCVLINYKYLSFLVENLNAVAGTELHVEAGRLPLAISFFTFQQIAFLVDTFRDDTKKYSFLEYFLFVTFFPQLIAGPIVRHAELLPQLVRRQARGFDTRKFAIGLSIFSVGLFKKVVIADSLGGYADPAFALAASDRAVSMMTAWEGTLAYTFQLYFDFSGYSDMAIGLGWMFGVRLPVNFLSPYRSSSIIEFWRRWHITLSRFIRDYLYIPLGGGHAGPLRQILAILCVMLLGGLWHGAEWNFVIWGALHGGFLVINHFWRNARPGVGGGGQPARLFSWGLTFICVSASWVVFRAENFTAAGKIYAALVGRTGAESVDPSIAWAWIGFAFLVCMLMPNTVQWFRRYAIATPTPDHALPAQRETPFAYAAKRLFGPAATAWRPTAMHAVIAAVMIVSSLVLAGGEKVKFLYFQF